MTNPLHAAHYADRACLQRVRVVHNIAIARDTYRLRIECPALAARIVPGQFVMVRLAGVNDPLLARPLALYDTVLSGDAGPATGIDVVYLVLGKMTRRLARLRAGDELEVWGPLGNGFPLQETAHLVMVAGGIGQTPFPALASERLGLRVYGDPPRTSAPQLLTPPIPTRSASEGSSTPPIHSRTASEASSHAAPRSPRVTLCYGARNKEYLAGVEDFRRLGVDVHLSTDDGSAGHRGFVTEVLAKVLDASPQASVVCCGPEPMMKAVARITGERNVPCLVSLETPMACGIGICFSCVAKVRDPGGGWDYRRTCVEGPVFDAQQIDW